MGPGGQSGPRRKHRSGFLLATRTKDCLLRRRRGVSSPPDPRRNQRLMIPSGPVWPPGPGSPWPLHPNFLQRAKMIRFRSSAMFLTEPHLSPISQRWMSPATRVPVPNFFPRLFTFPFRISYGGEKTNRNPYDLSALLGKLKCLSVTRTFSTGESHAPPRSTFDVPEEGPLGLFLGLLL